jgi:ABC-2 type transport system ATP-binding protein
MLSAGCVRTSSAWARQASSFATLPAIRENLTATVCGKIEIQAERRGCRLSDARRIIELNRVAKSYGTKTAVHDLSLAIEAGQMFGLLGPNGAGKTSTIRMMIGMTLPDSGTVTLFGQPFSRHCLHRLGYLPEERGLYKKMKVVDQLVLLGQLHGLNGAQAEIRAREWCQRLEIAGSLEKRTEELSKGMQQKIQFIASILHDPELIIMDEPFSGLDPVNATMLQDVLIDLKHKGKAILFSTHRMDQVERLCDSICLMNQGHAVLAGTVRGVKSRYPKNRVRIRYEGDASFLDLPSIGSVSQNNGTAEICLREGFDPQEILIAAMARARVSYFDVIEPTLEEIFIDTVGDMVNA